LAVDGITLVSLSSYGTFYAGGVVAEVSDDDDRDASATLDWRLSGSGTFAPAHPLIRIDGSHFVGSLFWLQSGTSYDVRVTVADPDGVSGGASTTTTLTTRVDTLFEPTLATLYVAPSGNDGNSGTNPGSPLRTIQRAADLAQAGTLVLIAPGVYRESVSVPRSGTSSQPIVFRGSAQGAILDGADEGIAAGVAWSAEANGVWSRVTGFATGHVVSELGRMYRYGSLSDLQALGAGAPGGYLFDGTTLYVKFANGSAPSAHTIHVARFEDGFFIDGRSFVRIEDLEIRHYGSGDYGKGVYLRYTSDAAVRGCRIHEVGSASVWIKGGERNLIEDNEIWDTSIFSWPWGFTKGSSAEDNGVVLTNDVGRGTVIRRNTIHGTFNGIGPCGSSAPPSGFTSETDVYENVLYQHTDDGIEAEGYCANVRVWGNKIADAHMAFAVAPAAPGPTWLVRNLAEDFGNTRTSQQDGYTASFLKINSGYPDPVGPLLLYHNTAFTTAPNTEAVSLLNPGSSTFIRARNNVFRGTRYVLEKYNPVALDWDYDLLHTTDSTRFVRWLGTRYDSLAAFTASTGQEVHGLSGDPQLADPAGGDFHPACGSPLVDAGIALPGINDDYLGAAPDVGAFEGATDTIETPALSAPADTNSASDYAVSWSATNPAGRYQLQEATDPAFTSPATFGLTTTNRTFNHSVTDATTYRYRVRAVDDCSGADFHSPWSATGSTTVWPAGCLLILDNQTISTTVVHESCGLIFAGPSLAVLSPGQLTLRAAQRVVLRNGFSVASGARLTVALDPTLVP
jgi:hypothetical protein